MTMSIAMAALEIIAFAEIESWYGIAAVLPIHQITGFKNRDPGKNEHGCGHHVIDVADADDVGIRKVGRNDWIGKGAVAVIAMQFLRRYRGAYTYEDQTQPTADLDRIFHTTALSFRVVSPDIISEA